MSGSITVSLHQSGDFVGVRPARVLTSAALAPADQARMEQLLQALHAEHHVLASLPPRAGSEQRQYRLDVTTADGNTSYLAREGAVGSAFGAMLDFVRAQTA